jgi:hypothetical protein
VCRREVIQEAGGGRMGVCAGELSDSELHDSALAAIQAPVASRGDRHEAGERGGAVKCDIVVVCGGGGEGVDRLYGEARTRSWRRFKGLIGLSR